MNRKQLVALMVFALDGDMLSFGVCNVISRFIALGHSIKIDPMYRDLENVAKMSDIEAATDYTLCYAGMFIRSGMGRYGIYDKEVLKYSTQNKNNEKVIL